MSNVGTQTTKIYALCDPNTSEVRYVGKTVLPIERRLLNHLWEAEHKTTHKANWIRSIGRPNVVLLEEVVGDDWQSRERYWIQQFDNLTNASEGGEGPAGWKAPPETKRKMSEAAKKRCENPKEQERLRAIGNGKPPLHFGETQHSAKLKEWEVVLIRSLAEEMTEVELADMFNVTRQNIRCIIFRKTWKHLP